MIEKSLSVSDVLPMEDDSETGTQLDQCFSVSPSRSSRFRKRYSEEGTSPTRENADQRPLLRVPFLTKGKEKMRNFSKGKNGAGIKDFVGCPHRRSSITVFPSYPVTRRKGLNSVGYYGMTVVENFKVSSHQFSKPCLPFLSPLSGLVLPYPSPSVPGLPTSAIQSQSLTKTRVISGIFF